MSDREQRRRPGTRPQGTARRRTEQGGQARGTRRRSSAPAAERSLTRDPRRSSGARRSQDARRVPGRQRPRRGGSRGGVLGVLAGVNSVLGLVPPLALLLVGVALAVAAVLAVMNPRLASARKEAQAAQARSEQLSREVSELNDQIALFSDVGVESPWTASGKFTSGDDTLDQEVKVFCDANSGSATTKEEAAFSVYMAIVGSDYVERDNAQEPGGDGWRAKYARQYFETDDSGNCYEFACAIMYCLRYLGYPDAKAEYVVVELQSGAWGEHGLCFVTNTDGQACFIDSSRGTNGWMLGTDAYNYQIRDVEAGYVNNG